MSMTEIATEPTKGRGRPAGSRNREGAPGRPKGSKNRGSAWHAGRLRVVVTEENIRESVRANSSHCIIAQALKAALPDARHVACDLQTCRLTQGNTRYTFLTPAVAQAIVINFDQGNDSAIEPCEFTMRPVHIAKSGKSRRHCPDPGALKEVGIKAARAPDSPLESAAPARKPADPWADDEAAAASVARDRASPGEFVGALVAAETPKPRKPRIRRQTISSVAKGCVPVSLGGRALPVSVLARREYGMRVLRK
jgi:hypothetical protein